MLRMDTWTLIRNMKDQWGDAAGAKVMAAGAEGRTPLFINIYDRWIPTLSKRMAQAKHFVRTVVSEIEDIG